MDTALAGLFRQRFGHRPASMTPLSADGSQRRYVRIEGGGPEGTVIGAHGPDADENRAFLSYSRSFRAIDLPVPEIFAADETRGIWLESDLGNTTLFSALSRARTEANGFPPAMLPVYEQVVDLLPRFQVDGGRVVDFDVAYPRPAFDRQSMDWDLNYFKYHFLKLAHIAFNEQRLENDFDRLTTFLLEADTGHFLYRDFQSRNIMLRDGQPWFIDYQGGRRGAPQYDIASLLYDAKADIPEAMREQLLERYINVLADRLDFERDSFIDRYRGYVLIRIMQAMGAYGYRGFFERKTRFLESVPYAAKNIAQLLESGLPIALPEIETVFRRIVDAWADRPGPVAPLPGLTVRIESFSYRRGYPVDESGHGGGFIFDCRSLPNPGRLAEYADLTGLDDPVIEYLEGLTETGTFWSNVRHLVDAHVDSYLRRSFNDTSIAFGCTGGQHRSVYLAERLARHLRGRHAADLAVRVDHRERSRWPQKVPAGAGRS